MKALGWLSLLLVASLLASCDDDPMQAPNNAPLARIVPPAAVYTGLEAQFRSDSRDFDGDRLRLLWNVASGPSGSSAVIADSTLPITTFVADLDGDYLITLRVDDGTVTDTESVIVTAADPPPIADAGPDRRVEVGVPVVLDGSASRDIESEPITYAWSFQSLPASSSATLSGASTVTAQFTPDAFGNYLVQLVVNDGLQDSDPDLVLIQTVASLNCDVSPTDLDFGLVATAGGAADRTFTLTNATAGTLSGTVIAPPPPFSLLQGAGAYSLAPSETVDLTLRFAPTESNPGLQRLDLDTGALGCGVLQLEGTGQVTFTQVLAQFTALGCNGAGCHSTSYSWASARASVSTPASSAMFGRPTQSGHSGGDFTGAGWGPGEFSYNLAFAWIEQGALDN